MTDLPKRLEAAGRKEAGESNVIGAWVDEHFLKGHRNLHPIILKMAEALEKVSEEYPHNFGCKAENKTTAKYTEENCDCHLAISKQALAELEKYVEVNK